MFMFIHPVGHRGVAFFFGGALPSSLWLRKAKTKGYGEAPPEPEEKKKQLTRGNG